MDGRDLFAVELEQFQGPLDLLLHLIRTQGLDIFDIPIARITEQFLRVVEDLPPSALDRAGEFLDMAATLVRIKAQMLFPRPSVGDEDEASDPRAPLVERLVAYARIQAAARALAHRQEAWGQRWPRGWREPRPRPEPVALAVAWADVAAAAAALVARRRPPAAYRPAARPVSVRARLRALWRALRRRPRWRFERLARRPAERPWVVATLLACLELAKRGRIRLRQPRPYGPLWVLRRRATAAVGDHGLEPEDRSGLVR